jgi:hypothetical protein
VTSATALSTAAIEMLAELNFARTGRKSADHAWDRAPRSSRPAIAAPTRSENKT